MKINCIANTNYYMLASVFTLYESNTHVIMKVAKYNNASTPFGSPAYEEGTYHYHSMAFAIVRSSKYPNGIEHNPYMFFEFW